MNTPWIVWIALLIAAALLGFLALVAAIYLIVRAGRRR